MKTKLFKVMLLLLCVIAQASGEMLLYTFSGKITPSFYIKYESDIVTDKITNIIALSDTVFGYKAEDTLTYSFLVDANRQGSLNDFSGEVVPLTTATSTYGTTVSTYDYFFTKLAGGSVLPDLTDNDLSRYYMGSNRTWFNDTASGTGVALTGGKFNHFTQVANEATAIEDWAVGTIVGGLEYSVFEQVSGTTKLIEEAAILSKLTLISIQNVPEASVKIQLICGFASLFLVALYRNRKRC